MFKLEILNILDEIKDNGHSLLDRVIKYLYIEKKVRPKTISILLCLSEAIVYSRIPKETKKAKAEALENEILKRHKRGSHPKEIAFDLKISHSKVYRTLRKKDFNRNFTC